MALGEWMEQLAAAAMLGSERAGDSALAASEAGGLSAVIGRFGPMPREKALLSAAGLAAVYARAGVMPVTIAEAGPVAPAASKPVVTVTSAQHLSLLLAGHYPEVLPEYLDLVAASGRTLPARHLPAMLSMAARDEPLRARVMATLDARGQWVAAQNRAWTDMAAPPEVEHYHTGTGPQRRALLAQLRQTNPAQARNLIAATWAEESPEDRAAFVALLAAGLSMEDEPFLEAALDDKRKEVRTAAASMLAALPDSRLSARMTARLTPLVKLSGLIKKKLAIEVPDAHDAAMARDGIDAKTARHLMGDKAWHLACIIAGTPLSFWAAVHADPPTLIKLTKGLEWQKAVIAGLATAALRQRHAAFAAAILAYWLNDGEFDWQYDNWNLERLVEMLSPAQREALLMPLLADKAISEGNLFLQALGYCKHAWTRAFSEQFLDLLWRLINSPRNYYGNQGLKLFSLHAHPSLAPAINNRLKAQPVDPSNYLDQFVSTLQFRHDIHKEF